MACWGGRAGGTHLWRLAFWPMRETTCGWHVSSFHPSARSSSWCVAISTAVSSLQGSSQQGELGAGGSGLPSRHVRVLRTQLFIRLTSHSHSFEGVTVRTRGGTHAQSASRQQIRGLPSKRARRVRRGFEPSKVDYCGSGLAGGSAGCACRRPMSAHTSPRCCARGRCAGERCCSHKETHRLSLRCRCRCWP